MKRHEEEDEYLRIIDFQTPARAEMNNVVRLALATEETFKKGEYHGDNWDDASSKRGADPVYEEYVKKYVDLYFSFESRVGDVEPGPLDVYPRDRRKNDMKFNKYPCFSVGIKNDSRIVYIYFGDKLRDAIHRLNGEEGETDRAESALVGWRLKEKKDVEGEGRRRKKKDVEGEGRRRMKTMISNHKRNIKTIKRSPTSEKERRKKMPTSTTNSSDTELNCRQIDEKVAQLKKRIRMEEERSLSRDNQILTRLTQLSEILTVLNHRVDACDSRDRVLSRTIGKIDDVARLVTVAELRQRKRANALFAIALIIEAATIVALVLFKLGAL